jgi:hypothetical protein
MTQSYRLLRASVKVFKVLAWVTLVLQAISGLTLLIVGGEPMLVMGLDMPARLGGVFFVLTGAANFYFLWLVSGLLQLLLDIRDRLPGGSA